MTDQSRDDEPADQQAKKEPDSKVERASTTLGRWEGLLKALAGVIAAVTLVVGAVIGLTKAFGGGSDSAAAPMSSGVATSTTVATTTVAATTTGSTTTGSITVAEPPVFHSGRITLRQDQGISLDTTNWTIGSAVGADLGLTNQGAEITSAAQIAVMSGSSVGYADCAAVTQWQSSIDDLVYAKQGAVLCIHTTGGRYARAQVVGQQNDQNFNLIMSFQITVWQPTSN